MVAPIIIKNKALQFFLVSSIVGCGFSTRTDNAVLLSLKNRGAVPLSAHNPYIAGNTLLAKEMERSSDLRGFIENRGTPKAIEITKGWTGPSILQLYYLDKGEYYTAEESGNTWLVTGPSKIPSGGIKLLQSLTEPGNTKAALKLEKTPLINDSLQMETSPLVPDSTPISQEKTKPTTTIESQSWHDPLMTKVIFLKNSASEAAEISPRGDIVHYVTYQGETLSMIARWYTLDVRNVGRIARINNITNPSQLDIGDTVILPSYLVKNKMRLTEEALNTLLRETKGPK